MDDSTIVCKCEEINLAEIETAIKSGAHTFDDIKRLTRCGMGPCQAKVCTNLVRQIISESLDKPLSDIRPPKMRMPLKPTRISALVGNEESSSVISVFNESAPKEGDEDHD
ncbi:(2Fe-2S)-binding protein [Virgibacillus dakarensis]|uniref:(2Fe-2S)-binding protein n=1 Tax=Virgibacillus dakarensis TaxID=1917889 RepID=UPI000B442C83|nr:(2Fe-2S)-binding protein [Virgibacillus dakarensis]MBT2217549.1 (2Fe-2S)-binding protein [Virgibacillus dakarensis]MTW87915.1 (2Fe-2S)-binding protein [Virgibacillus dakarensis]